MFKLRVLVRCASYFERIIDNDAVQLPIGSYLIPIGEKCVIGKDIMRLDHLPIENRQKPIVSITGAPRSE